MWKDGSPAPLSHMIRASLICKQYLKPSCNKPMSLSGLGPKLHLMKLTACESYSVFLMEYEKHCGAPTTQVFSAFWQAHHDLEADKYKGTAVHDKAKNKLTIAYDMTEVQLKDPQAFGRKTMRFRQFEEDPAQILN